MENTQMIGVSIGAFMVSAVLSLIYYGRNRCPCILRRQQDDLELSLMEDDHEQTNRVEHV